MSDPILENSYKGEVLVFDGIGSIAQAYKDGSGNVPIKARRSSHVFANGWMKKLHAPSQKNDRVLASFLRN
jgi:hypothetical protein